MCLISTTPPPWYTLWLNKIINSVGDLVAVHTSCMAWMSNESVIKHKFDLNQFSIPWQNNENIHFSDIADYWPTDTCLGFSDMQPLD